MKRSKIVLSSLVVASVSATGCQPPVYTTTAVPAKEYSEKLRAQYMAQSQEYSGKFHRPGEFETVSTMVEAEGRDRNKARIFFAADQKETLGDEARMMGEEPVVHADLAVEKPGAPKQEEGFTMKRSSMRNTREYVGPLTLGNPGVTASLWQESRSNSDLFHDSRAWQPMDLITIIVSENSEGANNANTEVKSKSTVQAAIENLLGAEQNIVNEGEKITSGVPVTTSLVNASTQNDFKGEGKTNRKGTLKGRISAMVVEVLPSGVLRIEGEKIVSVNSEQQIMVISGLVRPRDVTSENEVDSARIAQLRVDYYGEGTVGEAQVGGWLGRIMRKIWPF
ncbi:MAG: flagellar basal body L-ring protein FlgH [Deltaproteobacteria bacterium]|nr:flagellar basal body L-ring protein FlgH [Deltaproteobacteria bacterium]